MIFWPPILIFVATFDIVSYMYISKKLAILSCVAAAGCVKPDVILPPDFVYVPVDTPNYTIATWQKMGDLTNPHVHIYIEGDGNSFNANGQPSSDPTPHGKLVRNLAAQDSFANVVYIARPCQFIMDARCKQSDWTDGRFSSRIIDAMAQTIKHIAKDKKIIIIGYSGGAMISGLLIQQHPEIKFEKWITVAGVLNHHKWTEYFGDMPLTESLDMDSLPDVAQTHFVGGKDTTVPYDLARQWAPHANLVLIKDATHNDFGDIKLF